MTVTVDDWVFDVDIAATMAYSAAEAAEHCTCGYCRNFYAAADGAFPKLRPFLAMFGLDLEAPDEMSPYPVSGKSVACDGEYVVFGRICKKGRGAMSAGDVKIMAREPSEYASFWNRIPEAAEVFVLTTEGIVLPWVLEEPLDEPPVKTGFFEKIKGLFS